MDTEFLLQIQPFDKTIIAAIEKAILGANLGVTPSNDGNLIRIPFPALTEERRKELVKYIGKITEEHKVAVRHIRKDVNNQIKDAEKKQKLPEDEVKKVLSQVQDLTDKFTNKLQDTFARKEKEILEI